MERQNYLLDQERISQLNSSQLRIICSTDQDIFSQSQFIWVNNQNFLLDRENYFHKVDLGERQMIFTQHFHNIDNAPLKRKI